MLKENWKYNKDVPPKEIENAVARAVEAVKREEREQLKQEKID